ncbi:MAG: TolC family protein [Pirellulales bacterium]|nr:TolC family protein [Pirellulales bacterium]
MSRPTPTFRTAVCLFLVLATGCAPQQPFYLFEDGDLSHYKGIATDIEVPDVDYKSLDEVEGARAPWSLTNNTPKQVWELSLEEAVRIALRNSKVLRSLGASLAAPDSLTRAPAMTPTIYDPARTESNPRFGTEAALSAFDAQFATSVFWEKVDRPMNVNAVGSLFNSRVSRQDLGTFQAKLSKFDAGGGQASISHNVAYEFSNSPTRAIRSDWNVDVTAEFRQPLFQGAGVQFNRIAGPGAIPGYNNGVVIARLKVDIALTDFEASVFTLASDVERAYWDLYLAYRELDSVRAGYASSLETWRKVKALYDQGARGGELDQVAQAKAQLYAFKSQVEQRLSNLYAAETQLRYMMGLAATDGRLIRPSDEPTSAKLSFEWVDAQYEALARNVDLRRQRWTVKQAELELISAKNYLLPRLDAVGRYQWLGLGDDLWDTKRQGVFPSAASVSNSAMESLTGGDFQQWQYGLEFSMPLGFRKEMAGVRHAQLNLVREKTLLKEQELEVSHQLTSAIRDLQKGIVQMQTNYNRCIAAKTEVQAVQTSWETGAITLNVLLDAQRRLAEAEIEYFRSVIQYNLAIVDIHYRKGSLLEYNGIYLAEGPWPGKAYFDARRRARARDAAMFLDYGFTQPKVLSRGAYQQHAGRADGAIAPDMPPIEEESSPELIPTPAPERPKATKDEDVSSGQGSRPGAHVVGRPRGKVAATTPAAGTAAGRLAARLTQSKRQPDETTWNRGTGRGGAASGVRAASFEEVGQPTPAARSRPSDHTADTPDEPDPTPTPAQAARPASGWKSVQR